MQRTWKALQAPLLLASMALTCTSCTKAFTCTGSKSPDRTQVGRKHAAMHMSAHMHQGMLAATETADCSRLMPWPCCQGHLCEQQQLGVIAIPQDGQQLTQAREQV